MLSNLPLTSPEEAARYRKLGFWKDETLITSFRKAADRFPDKIAVIDGERRFTYSELKTLVDNVAGNLLDLGLQQGDVVALQSRNAVEMPLLHLACNRIGVLYMPIHDAWRETELAHLLKVAKVKAIALPIVYRDFNHLEMLESIRAQLPDLKAVFTLDGTAPGCRPFSDLTKPTKHPVADLDARSPDPDLPAHIMLSGGTTALSKISRYSSNDLRAMLALTEAGAGFDATAIIAALAPAGTGATGYVYPVLMPLLHGATSVILDRWGDPEPALQLVLDHKCTHAVGIPTQLTRLIPCIEQRKPEEFEHFRCFIDAGAPMTYETGLKVETLMGCATHTIYGATDGGSPTCTSIHDAQEKRLRTVGRVAPGVECELRDPSGKAVPQGESGEVVWRAPHKSWGYLGDDAQTAAVFTADHFYKSGDVGRFDQDGYLQIVGRIKDMILRGGRNIFPALIEDMLMKHPAILDVSVAAMPDPELGERACAFVILKNGASLDFATMTAFLKDQKIAIWQLPERLEIVTDLPKGVGGKVTKSVLTEMIAKKLKAEGKA